jgi:hypothetical protein
MVEAHMQT